MVVISFDLSTSCTGVFISYIDNNSVKKTMNCKIVPQKFDVSKLGYLPSKKKCISKNGKTFSSYIKANENNVSENVKKSRDVEVRNAKNIEIITYLGKEIDKVLSVTNPDLVVVEKNEVFNGILTSTLLAKTMGALQSLCGARSIPIFEYRVQDVRKPYDVNHLVLDFVKDKEQSELKKIPDITKRAIRAFLEKKYSISFSSDDESDACLVFDYWFNYVRKENR